MTMFDVDAFKEILNSVVHNGTKTSNIIEVYSRNPEKYSDRIGVIKLLKGFNVRAPQIDLIVFDLLESIEEYR